MIEERRRLSSIIQTQASRIQQLEDDELRLTKGVEALTKHVELLDRILQDSIELLDEGAMSSFDPPGSWEDWAKNAKAVLLDCRNAGLMG